MPIFHDYFPSVIEEGGGGGLIPREGELSRATFADMYVQNYE